MRETQAIAENWKYTSLALLDAQEWKTPSRPVDCPELPSISCSFCGRVVFYNGFLMERLCSLPEGVRFSQDIHNVIQTESAETVIADMNAAYLQDSISLIVEEGTVLSEPLDVVFLSEGDSSLRLTPGLSVVCEPRSSFCLLERHVGGGRMLSAVRVCLFVQDGACVEHVRIEDSLEESVLLEALDLQIEKRASYAGFFHMEGGRLSRCQIDAGLFGEEASVQIEAEILLRGVRTGDLTTRIRHVAGGARSSQQVRSILEGPARGVYQGKIQVDPGADGTDARQNSRTLLLTEGAEMDTKPELEILADDVKCTHGAASGALDPEALFYLRSRGVPEAEARILLVQGMLSSFSDRLSCSALRDDLVRRQTRWLEKCGWSRL